MGYDLHFTGSNTCILRKNEFIYTDLFTLSIRQFNDPWVDGFKVLCEAPIQVKENSSADFSWQTGIYTYEQLIALAETSDVIKYLKRCVKKQPYCKYIFIQVY